MKMWRRVIGIHRDLQLSRLVDRVHIEQYSVIITPSQPALQKKSVKADFLAPDMWKVTDGTRHTAGARDFELNDKSTFNTGRWQYLHVGTRIVSNATSNADIYVLYFTL